MISIRGLHKSFGAVSAVRGVDLEVAAGESLLLLGQNGAGKSTTLRCAGGLLQPDAGDITFGPLQLPADVEAVRHRLGVVPDQPRLYGRNTAREYLQHFGAVYGVPQPQRTRRIDDLLGRFDLDDAADRPTHGYSRGMAQKVALIRATLHEPDWIFCDEPTVGLDPVAAAEVRRFLGEQRSRGAAVILTTHVLGEAELLADRVAIMRAGRVVTSGTLPQLARESRPSRRFRARLEPGARAEPVVQWLESQGIRVGLDLTGDHSELWYEMAWGASDRDLGAFAAALQARLLAVAAPFLELREEPPDLESIYLHAMGLAIAADPGSVPTGPALGATRQAIRPSQMAATLGASLSGRRPTLTRFLPFYVSAWWRRGDLSWILWLNAFVLLLVAGVSLFGSTPAVVGGVAALVPRGAGLQAGLLLPLFFMSFALLESIKSSIGIWWEKAQQSLEVLLYTPLTDSDLVWLEVLPGMVVSLVYVTAWMTAGLALMALFGHPAPWSLLPVFALVAAATAYWAAMGRLLGFMLFPREGAAGGAWSFLLSPVSAAVADLPLALFVFGSPFAPLSLALPLGACLALTLITGSTFDRERLLETGASRERPARRGWFPSAAFRRRGAAMGVTALAGGLLAAAGFFWSTSHHFHDWPSALAGHGVVSAQSPVAHPPVEASGSKPTTRADGTAARHGSRGVALAAAGMGGIVAAFALLALLLALAFASFFLLGIPQLVLMPVCAAAWGAEAGFGSGAPLAPWLTGVAGLLVLGVVINTGASLPLYTALVLGAGTRIERLRAAWADYFAIFRAVQLPLAVLFGVAVLTLLARG